MELSTEARETMVKNMREAITALQLEAESRI